MKEVYVMREIELKFKVENLEGIISQLESFGCKIGTPIFQNDRIFVEDLNNVESKEGSVWLRLRKLNDKIELNYKKQGAIKAESQEIEFEVSSYEKANDLLTALGFKPWVQVNKVRRYTKYKDCNICIDQVERLGNFVELELLIEEQDDINYEEKLFTIASELNIDLSYRIFSHYDTMMAELND